MGTAGTPKHCIPTDEIRALFERLVVEANPTYGPRAVRNRVAAMMLAECRELEAIEARRAAVTRLLADGGARPRQDDERAVGLDGQAIPEHPAGNRGCIGARKVGPQPFHDAP